MALLKKILKYFLIIIFTILISEAWFRIMQNILYKVNISSWDHPSILIKPDSPIIYYLKPNIIRKNIKIHSNSNISWSYKLNSDGLRCEEINDKDEDSKLIMFLGDSFTFGWAVDDTNTSPYYVNKLLKRNKLNVQVINAGIPGYNTEQEYYFLIKLTVKYKPDIVVLNYVVNDAEPQHTVPMPPHIKYKYSNSRVFEFIKEIINNIFKKFGLLNMLKLNIHIHNSNLPEGFNPESPKWKESKKAIKDIALFCKNKDIKFIIFILPAVNFKLDNSYPYRIIHKEVLKWGKEFEIKTIDLFKYFKNEDHKKYRVPEEGHPNSRANRKIAQIIGRELIYMLK